MEYTKDHISKSKTKRPGINATMQYLTIHNTGNPKSTARNERDYLTNPENNNYASFHIVLDEKQAIECIPLDEVAYHTGTSAGNNTSVGIEICESGDQAKVWDNATTLLAKMLDERKWGVDKLRTHKSWSGKECPRLILPKLDKFVTDVKSKMKDAELVKALDKLKDSGIISTPDYWLENAKKDKVVKGEYAATLIKNMAKKL